MAAPPEGTNGDATPVQRRPLPCWDWLHAAAARGVAEAQHAWEEALERGTFAMHGWSLPYPYQDVKRVCAPLRPVRRLAQPAADVPCLELACMPNGPCASADTCKCTHACRSVCHGV